MLEDIINNSWFIGVAGGLISGFLVWFITNKLFKSKQTQEYVQKVMSVNRELVYSLRSGISQKNLPNLEVLTALRNSTSRKYFVDINDIYTNKELAEELIKEVMDSSFIPVESKASFCDLLSPLMKEDLTKEQKILISEEQRRRLESKNDVIQNMSLTLAVLVAVFTFITTVTQRLPNLSNIENTKFLTGIFIPSLTALLATATALVALRVILTLKKKDEKTQKMIGGDHFITSNIIIREKGSKDLKSLNQIKKDLDEAS